MSDDPNIEKGFLERIPSFSLVLIMIILVVIGAALIPKINISYFPSSKQGKTLNISFSWPGASPRVIEQEVTSKIEGLVSSVNGVEQVTSSSDVGRGRVSVQLSKKANVSAARFEIASLLKQINSKLPEGVSYPNLTGGSVDGNRQNNKHLLSYQINADMTESRIEEYVNTNIKPYLERVEGVKEVNVSGAMPQYIEITYDPVVLNNYGLNSATISDGIRNFLGKTNIIGDIERVDSEGQMSRITLLLSTSELGNDISRVPLKKVDDKIIYLNNLATVSYKDRIPESYYRINGLNTIYLNITVDADANLIAMSEEVREQVDRIKTNLVDGFYVRLTYDAAKEIKTELYKLLRRTALSLVILLLFVLIASRSFRYMLIITATLIANIFIAVIFYYLFDLELHIFSLAGIAVSLGIIIDSSIVMVDHYSYYHNRKVYIAILAALLTTIAALVIIFFMPDYIKNNLYDFSLIIIINLTVALFVSLLFVPAIIDRSAFSSREKIRKPKARRRVVVFSRIYSKYIRFTQHYKWIYIVIFILAFGLPIHLLPAKLGSDKNTPKDEQRELTNLEKLYNQTIGGSFYQSTLKKPLEISLGGTLRLFSGTLTSRNFSEQDENQKLYIGARMPEGSTPAQLNVVVRKMDNFLSKFKEIKRFETRIDRNGASIQVEFKDDYKEGSFPLYLKGLVISQAIDYGGADWSVHGIDQNGFSNSLNMDYKSNRITLSGYNYDKLYVYAEQLMAKMQTNKRVADTEIQSEGGWNNRRSTVNELYVKYDKEKVALYDFRMDQGYNTLNEILGNSEVGSYDNDGVRTDIVLNSSQIDKFDVWNLFNSYITVGDKQIRYSQMGEISKRQTVKDIPKKDQEYSLDVAFNFIGSYELSDRYTKTLLEEFNSMLPVGFKAKNSSYNWYDDTGSQYWLLLLIAVIIFFMCAILFESLRQPFIIISLIPISFIGVFLTFYFSEIKFGNGGFAAMVLLSGLVVNAAIYIVNEYNNTMRSRSSQNHNVANKIRIYTKSYNHKIIPVLLTILSTVLGLIPFLTDGKEDTFWFAFAIGATGGLLFSIIALVFIMPIFMPFRSTLRNCSILFKKETKRKLQQKYNT